MQCSRSAAGLADLHRPGGDRMDTTPTAARPAPRVEAGTADAALTAQPLWWSRVEGAALAVAGLAAWVHLTGRPWLFWALVLVPDLGMLAYLAGPRAGAWVYNALHALAGPAACALAGLVTGDTRWLAAAACWAAHVGIDRALGYGLKYASGFGATHLGRIGAARR